MRVLAITEHALQKLLPQRLSPEWFVKVDSADLPSGVLTNDIGGVTFLYSSGCSAESRFLVINTSGALFGSIHPAARRGIFDRCARIALNYFDKKSVRLPPGYLAFHWGNRISIFGYGIGEGKDRLVAETGPQGSHNVYVCAFDEIEKVQNLRDFEIDYGPYDLAIKNAEKGLKARVTTHGSVSEPGEVTLTSLTPDEFSNNLTFNEWYPTHLSTEQLTFVEHPLDRPIKLRGAAGTGKTMAMAIKALKTIYDAEDSRRPFRLLFTTHSWSAAEALERNIRRIDIRDSLRKRNDGIAFDIFPLITLADDVNDYKTAGRRSLGQDSNEGKKLVLGLLGSIVESFRNSDWFTYKDGCTRQFSDRIEAPIDSRSKKLLLWDLMIEFACVIGAAGIFPRVADKQKYLRIRRMRWMLPLASDVEKSVVFALYGRFIEELRRRAVVTTDQIVSDYLNHLSTFYWDSARRTEGYDAVFVDEMHLFNAQERLVFHNLLASADSPPAVVMALDPKQSPRETFTNITDIGDDPSANILSRAGLPDSESIDLTEVYRYTPQINALIKSLDNVVPALDLDDDWDLPPAKSEVAAGEVPQWRAFPNKLEMFKFTMERARRIAKAGSSGKRIAVLGLDHERFSEYAEAAQGQFDREVFVISSRDDTETLRYATRRVALSMPEYVAGLQFQNVIILDANRDEVPDGANTGYALRRFLSELYLAISRAQERVEIYSTADRGGLSRLLQRAITDGLLVKAEK